MAGGSSKAVQGDYAKDGSVDLKGRPVLRSKRGGWSACYFIVGTQAEWSSTVFYFLMLVMVILVAFSVYEVFERMAYYGISSNLVLYLTRQLHQGTVASANNVTNWVGTGFLTPILGAYIADAYLGRYCTFAIASAVYFLVSCILLINMRPPYNNRTLHPH